MQYGSDIGRKFYEDGSVRRYPGNTVVASILPGNSAYNVMIHLRQMVINANFASNLIFLPEDSYHMTFIRGVNDQVRIDTHWPPALPKDACMTQVDDFVSAAIARAKTPGPARMKFDKVNWSSSCLTVRVLPADDQQEQMLRDFRNRAAAELGLFLPGHDNYAYHITLGYTRIVCEGDDLKRQEDLIVAMNEYIADKPKFETSAPYMAFYDDMLFFSPVRIPRDR